MIRRQAGRNGQEGDGDGAREGDQARLDRGVRQRKNEERVRDGGRLRARARQELPRLQQDEVAVAPERYGGHARDAIRLAGAAPSLEGGP